MRQREVLPEEERRIRRKKERIAWRRNKNQERKKERLDKKKESEKDRKRNLFVLTFVSSVHRMFLKMLFYIWRISDPSSHSVAIYQTILTQLSFFFLFQSRKHAIFRMQVFNICLRLILCQGNASCSINKLPKKISFLLTTFFILFFTHPG